MEVRLPLLGRSLCLLVLGLSLVLLVLCRRAGLRPEKRGSSHGTSARAIQAEAFQRRPLARVQLEQGLSIGCNRRPGVP